MHPTTNGLFFGESFAYILLLKASGEELFFFSLLST